MAGRRAWALMLGLACAGRALAAAEAEVTLRSEVELSAPELTLGAVARIDSADGDLASRLAALPLGASPQPGRTVDLGRARIQEALGKEGLSSAVSLLGPDLVRVRRKSRRISGEELAAAAEKAVLAGFAESKGAKASCEVRILPQDVEAPGADVRLEAVPPAPGAGGVMLVPVRVLSGGRIWATRSVSLRVKVTRSLVTALRDLPRGWKLQAGDLGLAEKEAKGPGEGFSTVEEALGRELKVPVRAGDPILPSRVQNPILVNKGDRVELGYGKGSVRVATKALAMESGGQGDRIEVKNEASGRTLRARVTGSGRVEAEGSDNGGTGRNE